MDRNRLLELAVEELERQKAGIDEEIAAVRAELGGKGSTVRTRSVSAGTRRRRTLAQRRAQAQRMREYWAAKRAQAAKPAAVAKRLSDPVTVAKVRTWTDAKKKALSLRMREVWKKRKEAAAKKAKSKATKAPE
jgi:hypothetical protein